MTDDDAALALLETAEGEVTLPTFRVLARLRSDAPDDRAALDDVRERLAGLDDAYDEVLLERREDDGSAWVVAVFMTVSVDAHTAVLGVHESLAAAGTAVDEVWVQSPPADDDEDDL